jgi:hypothetical protein
VRGTTEGPWRVLAGAGEVHVALCEPLAHIPRHPSHFGRVAGAGHPDLKRIALTPQFLRSEAARFRDMAESTDREASRQRLLAMAVDYEAQAEEAEKLQPQQMQSAEPEPASAGAIEPELASDGAIDPKPGVTGSSSRLRLSRKAGPRRGI